MVYKSRSKAAPNPTFLAEMPSWPGSRKNGHAQEQAAGEVSRGPDRMGYRGAWPSFLPALQLKAASVPQASGKQVHRHFQSSEDHFHPSIVLN